MIFLRRLLDLPFLVVALGISTLAMLLPAAQAVALLQFSVARAFFYSGSILFILTAMIALATSTWQPRDRGQSQLVAVVVAYLVVPFVLAVPLHQAVPGLRFVDAWFEMLSSFTTTGATVFDSPAEIVLPVHFWRALTGWMGGFFILLVTVSVLAPRGLGGADLRRSDAASRGIAGLRAFGTQDPAQRLVHFAGQIIPPYVGLTLLLWVALLLAGDSAIVALCHAMGALSSSGISSLAGVQEAASGLTGEVLIFAFMALLLTRGLWPGTVRQDRAQRLWQDPETGLAFGIVLLVAVLLVLHQALSGGAFSASQALRAFWGAGFTALSFLTTTGFQSTWWQGLGAPGVVLIGLVIIGGGVATTAGGVKLLRIYALLRHGERELERIVHPHSIGGHGPVARRLRREGAYLAWIFFMLFGLSIVAVTAALTFAGLVFEDAVIFGIAALSTTGPLASVAGDVPLHYSDLATFPKVILAAAMILGRLEILTVFAVLAPNGWRR